MWRSLSCIAFSIYEVAGVAWHSRIWVVVYIKKKQQQQQQLRDWQATRTTSILKQYDIMSREDKGDREGIRHTHLIP